MRIQGRCTSVVRYGKEVAIQIRGDERDKAGVLQGKAVVIYDAASECMLDEQPLVSVDAQAMVDSLIAAAQEGDAAAISVMKAAERVVRKRAEEAALKPLPSTIEECDAECRRRLPNNRGIVCENDGGPDCPHWRVYTRSSVIAAYLAIYPRGYPTCLAAWQAAVRKLWEAASDA